MGRIMTVFDIDFGKYEEKCHAQHMEVEFNSDVYPPRIVLHRNRRCSTLGRNRSRRGRRRSWLWAAWNRRSR